MPAIPTPQQLAWADAELGVIIHLDVQTFEPDYEFRKAWGYTPSPAVVDPRHLDTDQWLRTAVAAGARYAVLVAKHCSGFSLWPTKAHDYSVASSPWRGGKGDIVGDFIASCRRHGIRPGLYYSTGINARCDVDNGKPRSGGPEALAAYNRMMEQQLTELWTQYGKLAEIWFDGGVLPVAEGGLDIAALVQRLQPDAVMFQGPPGSRHLLRWVGNECGWAPDDCWSSSGVLSAEGGTFQREDLGGSPDGVHWAPAEVDMPNRDCHRAFMGGWFWRAGEDHLVYDAEHLFSRYLTSVGRNGNLLLGMAIDCDGLVPEADAAAMRGLGELIRERLGRPIAALGETKGSRIELPIPGDHDIEFVELMEDQAEGHRITGWRLEAEISWARIVLASGGCIGHKRICRVPRARAHRLRLVVTAQRGEPVLRRFAAYGRAL